MFQPNSKENGAKLIAIPSMSKTAQANRMRRLVVPIGSGVQIIDPSNILFIEADGSYTTIYLNNEHRCFASRTLKEFSATLVDYAHFIRIHKSFMVNANYISKYSFHDGISVYGIDRIIPVARRRKEVLFNYLESIKI